MGLNSVDELRSFCLELSNDHPSPGGGTASAAAGAMAASLLVMVCDITARSKKHEDSRPELMTLKSTITTLRDELVLLSLEDAKAYDLVVDALRARKSSHGETADTAYQAALKHASEVPQKTATACVKVIESAVAVGGIGVRSAWSDIGVALHLAHAGFDGAAMNVRTNIADITDKSFVKSAQDRLSIQKKQVEDAIGKGLSVLAGR